MSALNPFAILGSIVTAILPDAIVVPLQNLIDKLMGLLQGETVLVIGNGAGVIIYLVAKAAGSIPDIPLADAIVQAGSAAALLNTILLTIRKYVYSPKTVAAIVASPPTAAGPIAAAEAAGVPTETIAQAVEDAPAAAEPAPVIERQFEGDAPGLSTAEAQALAEDPFPDGLG